MDAGFWSYLLRLCKLSLLLCISCRGGCATAVFLAGRPTVLGLPGSRQSKRHAAFSKPAVDAACLVTTPAWLDGMDLRSERRLVEERRVDVSRQSRRKIFMPLILACALVGGLT